MKPHAVLTSICLLTAVAYAAVPAGAQNGAGTPPASSSSTQNAPPPGKIILNAPGGDRLGTLTTNQAVYRPGKPVQMTFTVSNPAKAKSPVGYNFPTAQQCDFIVTDGKGAEVWRWSSGRRFAAAITHISLPPGQSWSYGAVWNGHDAKGQSVAPGVYTITAHLTSNNAPAITGGIVVNRDTDPNNIGTPTHSPAETGAVRQVDVTPPITATTTVTIGSGTRMPSP